MEHQTGLEIKMNSMKSEKIETVSRENFSQMINDMLDWLNYLGVQTSGTRLEKYKNSSEAWVNFKPSDQTEISKQVDSDMISTAIEISDYLEIHDKFKDTDKNKIPSLIKKLKESVLGSEHQSDEDIVSHTNDARNKLFEAFTTSRIHRPNQGAKAILSPTSDAGFKFKQFTIWLECKRLTSEKKFLDNYKKACEQLEKSFRKHPQTIQKGIVTIDVTKIITRPTPNFLFVTDEDVEIPSKTEALLKAYIYDNAHVFQSYIGQQNKNIIGTLFRTKVLAVSKQQNNYITANQWQMVPRNDSSQSDMQLLQDIVTTLG